MAILISDNAELEHDSGHGNGSESASNYANILKLDGIKTIEK